MSEPLHLRVPKSMDGRRLDQVLEALCPQRTRSQLQKLVRRGCVRLDGRKVQRSNIAVPARAEIVLKLDVEPRSTATGPPEIRIVHEDEHIVVVDKPSGLLTHPAPRSDAPDLVAQLRERFGPLPTPFGAERPGIVHRLDRETSGCLVVGRTLEAMHALKEHFREQRVEKTYLALTHRVPPPESFVVDAALEPVPEKSDRQRIAGPGAGKPAITHVRRLEAFPQHALVRCRPRTGRRHQIRVHLAQRGFPVLGDALYGTKRAEPLPAGLRATRLMLHAQALALPHPIDGQPLHFESDPAADFQSLLEGLRKGR